MMNIDMGVSALAIGSDIMTTNGLKVMSFNKAMASPDKKEWEASVQCEHD